MDLSVCSTNYNCAHALDRHLESVFRELDGFDFEYIVVDNRSKDSSWRILHDWGSSHPNVKVISRRCTMGEGREIAFSQSSSRHILVLDTDVVYSPLLRTFVARYMELCPSLSVQAIWGAIFVREQWVQAGGRRSLNTNEDADLWLRICKLGTMRWYPVRLGENLKETTAWGRSDHLSSRYPRRERVLRLLRREWDLHKTREAEKTDLQALIDSNTIDLRVAHAAERWPQNRTRRAGTRHFLEVARELKQVWLAP